MHTHNIQVLLLDADGVVVLPNRFALYRQRQLGISEEMASKFFDGPFLACLVGKADLKQAIAPFLRRWKWRGTVDSFLQRWFDEDNALDPRVMVEVRRVRRAGLRCGLATNQERYRLEYMQQVMGLQQVFDAIFCSAEVGVLKDDPRFYERVTRQLDVPRQAVLFWDDSARNVQAARAFGWQAELYQGFEDLQSALADYLPPAEQPSATPVR
jgi:putative hydrolase of the HAD superfamily